MALNLTLQTSVQYTSIYQEVSRSHPDQGPLAQLKCLKLKQTGANDTTLSHLLPLAPALERLDVSFTGIRNLSWLGDPCIVPQLKKLCISGAPLRASHWTKLLELPNLETLAVGVIGQNGSCSLMDSALERLTDVLASLPNLQNVNLVGNAKLGLTTRKGSGALADFVSRIGRKCKVSQTTVIRE